MLNLASGTDPAWVHQARLKIDQVLLDHTHCEKKAAGAAVKLLFSYPHHRFMQEPLARLAREELEHFEMMLTVLDDRGIRYESLAPSAYGALLHAEVRRDEPNRALDILIVAAIIEARSCERLKLLSEAVSDPELSKLLSELLPCEARHHRLYFELASKLAGEPTARVRLKELAQKEAVILSKPSADVRLHS
ncbi:MAG: hypothetical protein CL917_06310 [Deltaproteobacteria bacterium]|nr:hypothetical protein [Deltaproteobacteria bacterium]